MIRDNALFDSGLLAVVPDPVQPQLNELLSFFLERLVEFRSLILEIVGNNRSLCLKGDNVTL